MFTSKATGSACAILSLLWAAVGTRPALAVQDHRPLQFDETRRAAFAGAAIRLELGRAHRPAAARLQVGLRSLSSGRQPEAPMRIVHVPVLEFGLAGREGGNLFIAGRPASAFEQRLGGGGRVGTTGVIIFSVALVAVGVLVITNLDGLGDEEGD